MHCRICQSDRVKEVGAVEFYAGFNWTIWDCADCGCRFTKHEEAVYDLLHAEENSSYTRYRELSALCKKKFDEGDLEGLKALFSDACKYRFIIDEISRTSRQTRLLEIGCARGSLASCFILGGWPLTGVDVSPEAVKAATANFGNHFLLFGSTQIEAGAPYDVIYHVGTIGCVADPIGMTRQLLGLLKEGGRLFFNAPNRNACWAENQLWFESAPPPDVVTLFPSGFWRRYFEDVADVAEGIEPSSDERSVALDLRRFFGRSWQRPLPMPMNLTAKPFVPPSHLPDAVWNQFERFFCNLFLRLGLQRFAPKKPSEYGLLVRMTKKQSASPIQIELNT